MGRIEKVANSDCKMQCKHAKNVKQDIQRCYLTGSWLNKQIDKKKRYMYILAYTIRTTVSDRNKTRTHVLLVAHKALPSSRSCQLLNGSQVLSFRCLCCLWDYIHMHVRTEYDIH